MLFCFSNGLSGLRTVKPSIEGKTSFSAPQSRTRTTTLTWKTGLANFISWIVVGATTWISVGSGAMRVATKVLEKGLGLELDLQGTLVVRQRDLYIDQIKHGFTSLLLPYTTARATFIQGGYSSGFAQ